MLVLIGIYYHYNPPSSPSPRHTLITGLITILVSKVVRLKMMT